MWFDKLSTWSENELKAMFEQAEQMRRMGCQSGLDVRVHDDLLAEMRRRKLPHPCPNCGSPAVALVAAGNGTYHCNQCGKIYE